jgi:hypothetical protein
VEALAFSPDGKTLVSGGLDGAVRFWDVNDGRETATLGGASAAPWGFTRSVRAVPFTPDGATLLIGGGPRTLRLFDVATRKETDVLWESPSPPARAVFAAAQVEEKQQSGLAKGEEKAKPQPASTPRQWPEHVDIEFHKGLDTYPQLSLFGSGAAAVTGVGPQGLRITLPAGRGDKDDVGVETQKSLRGDFEVTLAYELIALPKVGSAWGTGAVLDVTLDTPSSPRVRLTRTQKPKFATFGSTYYALDDDGKRISQALQYPRANENVLTGRLRLVRTGADLACQVDEGGTGFRTIATKEVGGADVVSVRAFATSGDQPFPVDLRFTNLDLRWDPGTRLASADQPAPAPRSRGWLDAAAIVVTVVVLSVLGVLLLVRRSGASREQPRETSPKPNEQSEPAQPRVTVQCPGCQQPVKAKAALAGKKVRCPRCSATIEVPSLAAELPSAKTPQP